MAKGYIWKFLAVFGMTSFELVIAGPPFISDDPVPVDYKHYEFILFANLDKNNNPTQEPQLQAPAIEFNYGIIPNIQFHLILPYVWSLPPGDPKGNGLGDIEVGVLYRFIEESKTRPQVGFYPIVEIPTGKAENNLSNGKEWFKLPLWFQKSWKSWMFYGGGGYVLNSQIESLNFPYGGLVLQKAVNDKMTVGAELYSQGAVNTLSSAVTVFNLGGIYKLSDTLTFTIRAGNSILGEQHLTGFISLNWLIG